MARRCRRKKRKVARWILDNFSHFSWMNASKRGCSNNFFRPLSTTWKKGNGELSEIRINPPDLWWLVHSDHHFADERERSRSGQCCFPPTQCSWRGEVKYDWYFWVNISVWTCQAGDAQSLDSFEGAAEAKTDSAPTPCASLSAPSLGLTALCRLPTMVCISSELSSESVTTCTWNHVL